MDNTRKVIMIMKPPNGNYEIQWEYLCSVASNGPVEHTLIDGGWLCID